MNRRSFLKGLMATGAAMSAPSLPAYASGGLVSSVIDLGLYGDRFSIIMLSRKNGKTVMAREAIARFNAGLADPGPREINSSARRQAAKATGFDPVIRGFESRRACHRDRGVSNGETERCGASLLLLQAHLGPQGQQFTSRGDEGSLRSAARRRQTDSVVLSVLQQPQGRCIGPDVAGIHGDNAELVARTPDQRVFSFSPHMASPLNSLCTPDCRSADYCWHYGCPFTRGES